MRTIHTVKEWLDVKDMYASAEMTLEVLKLNGELTGERLNALSDTVGRYISERRNGNS